MTPDGSTSDGAVGIVLHKHGTLRLFRNDHGHFYAEVVGFVTDEGRAFLEQLGELADIAAEVLVCDEPDVYRAPVVVPRLHRRRMLA